MAKKMLIDATHAEETRVVVVDGTQVDEFDFETVNKRQIAGNIYLAKVTRVEPSLQAAFVDYGGNRHGFLAFSEIHPDYYQIPKADREALLREEAEFARAVAKYQDEMAAREPVEHVKDTSTLTLIIRAVWIVIGLVVPAVLAWRVLFNSPDLYTYFVNRELFYDVTIWCTLVYFVFAWWDLRRGIALRRRHERTQRLEQAERRVPY